MNILSTFPPADFPWGVVAVLGVGLLFTLYCLYYILRLAYLETKDDQHIH